MFPESLAAGSGPAGLAALTLADVKQATEANKVKQVLKRSSTSLAALACLAFGAPRWRTLTLELKAKSRREAIRKTVGTAALGATLKAGVSTIFTGTLPFGDEGRSRRDVRIKVNSKTDSR